MGDIIYAKSRTSFCKFWFYRTIGISYAEWSNVQMWSVLFFGAKIGFSFIRKSKKNVLPNSYSITGRFIRFQIKLEVIKWPISFTVSSY